MGYFLSYGVIFQVLALIHFARRRPDTWWIFVIIFGGGLGALVYLVVEALPDRELFVGLLDRRKRIHVLEGAVALNPSSGNHEELAGLYLDEGKYAQAKQHFDAAIAARIDSLDAFYRRGICEIMLGDFPSAAADLEQVVQAQPRYDLHRAAALLARAFGKTGQPERAEALFREVTALSTLSEARYYYAEFLAGENRVAEGREWAQRLLDSQRSMPGFQRRRDRIWLRRAKALLRRLR